MLRRMRWVWLAVALLAAGAVGARAASAATFISGSFGNRGGSVDVSFFYQSLAPYGSWVDYAPYGWCWEPNDVAVSWRPYSDGEWVYTDYGWTWVDNEPWGWGPMHYGRWVYSDADGWLWVPGTTWGPAWVAWASYDDYVGWAPLPPDYGWSPGLSLSFSSFDVHRVPSNEWCFVNQRDLTSSNLRTRLLPTSRVATFVPQLTNHTHFASRNGWPVNTGIDLRQVERVSGRPVPRMQLVDAQRPQNRRMMPSGNRLEMFRAKLAPAPRNAAPAMSARANARDLRGNRAMNEPRGNGGAPRDMGYMSRGRDMSHMGRGRATREIPNMPDRSASAARNQERQRFDLNQARGNGQPPRPTLRQWRESQRQADNAQVMRNRNGYPARTIEQQQARDQREQYRNVRPAPSPQVMPGMPDRGPRMGHGGGGPSRPVQNGGAPQVMPRQDNGGGRQEMGGGRGNSDQPHGNGNGHGRDRGN